MVFPAFWESHRAMPATRTAPFASTRWVSLSLSHKSLLCTCKPSDTREAWSQDGRRDRLLCSLLPALAVCSVSNGAGMSLH